jgi:hypothetical protein
MDSRRVPLTRIALTQSDLSTLAGRGEGKRETTNSTEGLMLW